MKEKSIIIRQRWHREESKKKIDFIKANTGKKRLCKKITEFNIE